MYKNTSWILLMGLRSLTCFWNFLKSEWFVFMYAFSTLIVFSMWSFASFKLFLFNSIAASFKNFVSSGNLFKLSCLRKNKWSSKLKHYIFNELCGHSVQLFVNKLGRLMTRLSELRYLWSDQRYECLFWSKYWRCWALYIWIKIWGRYDLK